MKLPILTNQPCGTGSGKSTGGGGGGGAGRRIPKIEETRRNGIEGILDIFFLNILQDIEHN